MHCLKQHDFLHLSEHRASFQLFCQYVYYINVKVFSCNASKFLFLDPDSNPSTFSFRISDLDPTIH